MKLHTNPQLFKQAIQVTSQRKGLKEIYVEKDYWVTLALKLIFKNVYTKTVHLINAKIASRNIAAKYLKNLESIGILKSIKEGREIIYINIPLFNLLKEI